MGPRAFVRTLRRELPRLWEAAPRVPGIVHEVLEQTRAGGLEMTWRSDELKRLREQIQRNYRRLFFAVAGTGLVLAGAVTLGLSGYLPAPWAVVPALGWVLGGVGVVFLARAWPKRNS